GGKFVEHTAETVRGEVFIVVGIDLHGRGVDTGTQALDLDPGELAVGGDVHLLADALVADFFQSTGTAQLAGRRAAELHVPAPDRRQVEHRVEGRDFEHADVGHAEKIGNRPDRRLRDPAAGLLLRAPQNRQDRRGLPTWRIFGD